MLSRRFPVHQGSGPGPGAPLYLQTLALPWRYHAPPGRPWPWRSNCIVPPGPLLTITQYDSESMPGIIVSCLRKQYSFYLGFRSFHNMLNYLKITRLLTLLIAAISAWNHWPSSSQVEHMLSLLKCDGANLLLTRSQNMNKSQTKLGPGVHCPSKNLILEAMICPISSANICRPKKDWGK